MKHSEALDLIAGGVSPGESWADLGAGTGTFTRALLELVGAGEVWAVDRDVHALRELRELKPSGGARLNVKQADFTDPIDLPRLDGILMANALHFIRQQEAVLERIARHLHPGGTLLLVEYDRTTANPWVPHPIPPARFRELAEAAGLSPPREIGRRPSRYHREMYAAVAHLPSQ